jgi:hypothetical protein
MSSVRWLERYLAKRKRARERAYYQRMTPTQRAARFANNARYKREIRARLLALSPVTCPACAVVFVRRRSNQVYCSRACKDRRQKETLEPRARREVDCGPRAVGRLPEG